jgi:hypothetical protein
VSFGKGDVLCGEGKRFDRMLLVWDGCVVVKKGLDTERLGEGRERGECDRELLGRLGREYGRVDVDQIKISEKIQVSKLECGALIGEEMMISPKFSILPVYTSTEVRKFDTRSEKTMHLDARVSKFHYEALTPVKAYIINYTDTYQFSPKMQGRLISDYLKRSRSRYDQYILNS